MAHQRRNLAATLSNPPSSMDSTLTKLPKPTTPSHPTPDLSQASFMLNYLSRLTSNPTNPSSDKQINQPQPQPPQPPLINTHFQAKAMTASAIADYSKFSLVKTDTENFRVVPKVEKETKLAKKASKEKPQAQKSTEGLQRKKLNGVLKNEEKDSNGGLDSRSLFEEMKIENLRMPIEEHDLQKRASVSLALSGGRRRSLRGSQVDLGDVFALNGVKVVSADMPPFMQIHAVDCARKAFDSMEKFASKALALTLKKEFDGVYGPAWHCIVGTSFGSFVTHSVGGFLYFSLDQKIYILLFKTTVQKSDCK